jgi:hypothetical protein
MCPFFGSARYHQLWSFTRLAINKVLLGTIVTISADWGVEIDGYAVILAAELQWSR